MKVAEFMGTEERVEQFGKEILVLSFESFSDIDDFQQEYELHYIDENISMFPYDLLKTCQRDSTALPVFTDVDEFVKFLTKYDKSFKLFGGFDVGRKKDKSELIILIEEIDNSIQKVGFMITMNKKSFEFQKNFVAELLKKIPVKLAIDQTGIGMNLAEDLKRIHPDKVKPISFTVDAKKKMVGCVLIRLQNKKLLIPLSKELARQIHSIKKNVTSAGDITYTVTKEKGHHGDKFWALALASMMGKNLKRTLSRIPIATGTRVTRSHTKRDFVPDRSFKLGKITAP